ncbi:unnamed protein product [Diatraea saccharalis]|uniref:Odorant receptor n=1 Tax=Diatraea saccharalis TaxID=40085 RepID=A0A9N9QXG5_9NEOP|nr:unnamed protein product [Diatraea saccharalis]
MYQSFYIFRHSRLFNSLQSRVMFFYVIVCSVMLCACAYQLTAATSAMQILVQVEYLIFGLSELFLFCWHSNEVMLKSEDVVLGPYESQWTGISRKHKKNIILLIGQLQNRLVYTAGPFTDLTVATFINRNRTIFEEAITGNESGSRMTRTCKKDRGKKVGQASQTW